MKAFEFKLRSCLQNSQLAVDTVGCVAIDNLQLKSKIWQRRTIQGAGSPTALKSANRLNKPAPTHPPKNPLLILV